MPTQAEKAETFGALHGRDRAFIIPNPYDVGTARLLEWLGFEALATTSAGFAFSMGRRDGSVDRETMLEHAAALAAATELPVSADLENGYADDPAGVAETVHLAARAGLAGCSIEDVGGREGQAPYDLAHAADRVRAAAEAAHRLPFRFTLTARAENFIVGRPDLRDTIARLAAFEEAGADVLYAPGLKSREDILEVVRSVGRPVNVLMGLEGAHLTVAELSGLGVKRISVGSALSRAALGAFLRAAREMEERGSFSFVEDAAKGPYLDRVFARWAEPDR
ncbi:MAG TPA: isocitrate lyase/phosphoenolpyruvate mutase family protein [Candidatus Cybelea sp.]|nr:isocitrate lyase/phosphoenolpyruvate mutase family protein [Candidatus Cybelea sp.]